MFLEPQNLEMARMDEILNLYFAVPYMQLLAKLCSGIFKRFCHLTSQMNQK